MRRFSFALLACFLLLMLTACSQTPSNTDTVAPATPSNVTVSAGNARATVTWQVSAESDLKQYTLYWGGAADNLADSTVVVEKAASRQTITGLTNDTMYFFAVGAEDTSGNKSERSEPVAVTPSATADTMPPTLLDSTPKNGATDVSVNLEALVFTFSEAMNVSTVVLSSSDYDTSQLTATWNADNTSVSFTRLAGGSGLESLKLYSFTLAGKDRAGNEGAFTVSFTTEKDMVKPMVVSSTPVKDTTNVAINSSIVLNFSEAMDRASVEANFSVSPAVTCSFAWSSEDSVVTCTPQSSLAEQTTYTATFGTEVKDKAGNTLELMNEQPFSFSFITGNAPDTTAPTVLSFLPEQAARGLSPGGTIIAITFSEAMNLASLEQALTGTVNTLSDSKPLVISSAIPDQDVQGYGYIFYLQNALDYNMVIQWTIGTDATDLSGNHLAQSVSGTFSLLRELTVTLPANPDTSSTIAHVCDGGFGCYNSVRVGVDLSVGIRQNRNDKIVTDRSFISFDLPMETLLSATAIQSAVLTLEQTFSYGDPFNPSNLSNMSLTRVDYGATLRGTDFETQPLNCDGSVCSRDFYSEVEANGRVDVLKFIRADIAERDARGNRSQYLLRFANNKSQNGTRTAYVQYDPPTLTITYLIP